MDDLPEECLSKVFSVTSPKDASRMSLVSSAFKVAADSDGLWGCFLPSDLEDIISQSSLPTLNSLPKKQLYFHLCDHPVLLANDTRSFALEKESGKKCYMLGAKGLSIIWGESPDYWEWTSLPDSRFPQAAELRYVWWLEINGSVETRLLSPDTRYGVFFVFKFGSSRSGFDERSIELTVSYERNENRSMKRVVLDAPSESDEKPKQRGDGWMETEMGEFFNEFGDNGSVHCRLWDFDGDIMRSGLIVEGIEFRPKVSV